MDEIKIRPKTLGGLVRSLSGIFITKDNPNGLTPKECTVLAALISIVRTNEITKEHKVELSNQLNQSFQVTTNYIAKFAKKKCVMNNRIHELFLTDNVIIEGNWN